MILSMSTARLWLRQALLVLGMAAALGAPSARAADGSADGGWFDPQSPGTNVAANPTAPPAVPPQAAAANAPSSTSPEQMPSLAPSPLLQDRQAERGENAQPSAPAPDPQERDPRALTEFRSNLDPYGSWVQHPTYGTVWVPSRAVVGSDFSPYVSSGHWALDDYDNWVWMSDYPFGRVVFHYGRWVWVSGTGWAWIPGYRYAPAWVHWRVPTGSYAYFGWAPMGPDYLWFNGYAVSFWYGGYTPWVFCPSAYAFHGHVGYYVVRDRVLVDRLAYNTRRYTPATVRVGATVRSSYAMSGPPLGTARIPAQATPASRIPAAPAVRSSFARSSSAPRAGFFSDRRGAVPRTDFRGNDAMRFRSSPSVAPRAGSEPSFHRTPSPVAPRASGFAPRTAPSPAAPRARSFDSGSRPSFGGSRPSFGGSRPSFGGGHPSVGGGHPSFGGGRPSGGHGRGR